MSPPLDSHTQPLLGLSSAISICPGRRADNIRGSAQVGLLGPAEQPPAAATSSADSSSSSAPQGPSEDVAQASTEMSDSGPTSATQVPASLACHCQMMCWTAVGTSFLGGGPSLHACSSVCSVLMSAYSQPGTRLLMGKY